MAGRLADFDANYRTGEARRFLSLRNDAALPGAARATLPEIMQWVHGMIREAA